jgi:hypothetical protein
MIGKSGCVGSTTLGLNENCFDFEPIITLFSANRSLFCSGKRFVSDFLQTMLIKTCNHKMHKQNTAILH